MSATSFAAFTPEALQESGNVTCLLEPGFRFAFCNPAWDSFALDNGGERWLAASVVGKSFFSVLPPVLTPFYLRAFDAAHSEEHPFEIDYDCSSPDVYREFRMQIFPLAHGFAVVHSLRLEHPHALDPVPPDPRHVAASGIITMCAHCRRTRRAAEPVVWDWVPDYLRSRPLAISHGLCPPCRQHFYGY